MGSLLFTCFQSVCYISNSNIKGPGFGSESLGLSAAKCLGKQMESGSPLDAVLAWIPVSFGVDASWYWAFRCNVYVQSLYRVCFQVYLR